MLCRANVLARNSGARPEVALLLLEMLNRRIHPVIPSQGSVGGASGDLAPLAHLALVPVGEGEATAAEKAAWTRSTQETSARTALPEPKEGISLLNGTQGC
jgi:histidine ammonia-lyase